MIQIGRYEEKDWQALIKLIEELQDHLIYVDPLKRLRRMPGYGENNIDGYLKKEAIIYTAQINGSIVGVIIGDIKESTEEEDLECAPSKIGDISELVVSEKYRGMNIGTLLMKKIEEHFQMQGCDIIRVDVFAPNVKTYDFYKKCGYQDRIVSMIKIL